MNVVFLIGSHPRDLTVAVRTKDAGYHRAYKLIETAHGWSDCDLITDSDQFTEIGLSELPTGLTSMFDFQQKLQYLETAYIHTTKP